MVIGEEALRWNPLPIAIPCHRVIGTSGSLTGYAGGKVILKRRLLAVEGVQLVQARGDFRIDPEIMYACAPGDHTYCVPTCRSLKRVKPGRATLFASRRSAEAAGLSPCTKYLHSTSLPLLPIKESRRTLPLRTSAELQSARDWYVASERKALFLCLVGDCVIRVGAPFPSPSCY